MKAMFTLPSIGSLALICFVAGCPSAPETSRIEYLSFSPNGKWLVAAGGIHLRSGQLKIWECSRWKTRCELTNDAAGRMENGRFVSENEIALLSTKPDERDRRREGVMELRFWDILEKKEIKTIELKDVGSFAERIDFCPRDKSLVFARKGTCWSIRCTVP